jgi:hypothetical protein
MSTVSVDRIQGLSGSLGIKAPCRVATTAAITLYGLQTVDGVNLATGDRVLVKNQANTVENGIYDADTGTWSRALDFNGTNDALNGTMVVIAAGVENGGKMLETSGTDPLVPGTSTITFTEVLTFADGPLTVTAYIQTLLDDANAAAARATLGAAASGGNSDITSLSGLTTPLSIVQGGTGYDTQGATIQNLLDTISTTVGAVLYRDINANGWQALAPGTAGQLLKTNGTSNTPEWATISSPTYADVNLGTITGPNLHLTALHTGATKPHLIEAFVVCLSAEYGYSVGDVCQITNQFNVSSVHGPWANASTVGVSLGSALPYIVNRSTGGEVNLTASYWGLRAHCVWF